MKFLLWLKEFFERLIALVVCLLPGACHYKWTAPWLYANSSSSAFDIMIGLWLLCILIAITGLSVACSPWRKYQK